MAADFAVARVVADFFAAAFAGCFFADDLTGVALRFAGLLEAVFLGRVGAIRSLHVSSQVYQMQEGAKQLFILRHFA